MKVRFKKTQRVAKYYGLNGEIDVEEGELFTAEDPDDVKAAKIWVDLGIADEVNGEDGAEVQDRAEAEEVVEPEPEPEQPEEPEEDAESDEAEAEDTQEAEQAVEAEPEPEESSKKRGRRKKK